MGRCGAAHPAYVAIAVQIVHRDVGYELSPGPLFSFFLPRFTGCRGAAHTASSLQQIVRGGRG